VSLCSQPSLTGTTAPAPCVGTINCPTLSLPGQCLAPCATLTLSAALCPQPGISVNVNTGGPYVGLVSQVIAFHASAGVSGTRRLCTPDATLGTGGPFCNLVPAVDLPAPNGFMWDFGDGTQAQGAAPGHAYGQPGVYKVTVTVYLDDGSTAVGATTATIVTTSPAG
jgi:hypothetical protein